MATASIDPADPTWSRLKAWVNEVAGMLLQAAAGQPLVIPIPDVWKPAIRRS